MYPSAPHSKQASMQRSYQPSTRHSTHPRDHPNARPSSHADGPATTARWPAQARSPGLASARGGKRAAVGERSGPAGLPAKRGVGRGVSTICDRTGKLASASEGMCDRLGRLCSDVRPKRQALTEMHDRIGRLHGPRGHTEAQIETFRLHPAVGFPTQPAPSGRRPPKRAQDTSETRAKVTA